MSTTLPNETPRPLTKPNPTPSSIPLLPSTTTDLLQTHCTYLLPTLFSRAASTPSLHLLDIGCGSGRLTTELALLLLSRSSAGSRVTGLDLSAAILESARLYSSVALGPSAPQIRYVQGSALALPFPDACFDVVHVHQVLSHVADPVRAVREAIRVVKRPGGVICLREGNLRRVTIEGPEEMGRLLTEFYGVLVRVQEGEGGVADGGARLRSWVEKARVGKGGVRVGEGESRYDTREKRRGYAGFWPARCTGGVFAEKAAEMGVRREKLEQYAKAWKDWIETEGALLVMSHGEVVVSL